MTPREPTRSPSARARSAARRLGIEQLYPEQESVIGAVLSRQDVLMVLPTGFGKSACYQVPSMVLPKPVVLISPLLALLRDQQQKLVERDIPCVRLDGTVRGRARREALDRIETGGSLLVMTTPETVGSKEMGDALAKSGIALVAVDEAHCISEWGHDFRPAYLQLGKRLDQLGAQPILALTATATPRVRAGIVSSLHMSEPTVVASSPHRSNLAFEVLPCEGDARFRVLIRLARRLRRPGIIYCATTREVEAVHLLLRRFGIPAHRYHGKLSAGERTAEQEAYMRGGRRSVMVATSAFGLGIDKPDIRYILHFQAPASLEQYVQEAGRGGRDGRKANCILLGDPSDRGIHEALLSRSRVRPEQLYRIGRALAAWSGENRNPSLEALALSAELGTRSASAMLVKIEEAGLVAVHDGEIEIKGPKESVEQEVRQLAQQFETLRTQDSRRLDALGEYVHSNDCRAVFLREYFGEPAGEPCKLCDVCRGRPERPQSFFEPLASPTPPRARRGGRSRGRRGRGAGSGKGAGSGRGGRRSRRGGRRRRPRSE